MILSKRLLNADTHINLSIIQLPSTIQIQSLSGRIL
jgi:hypothetical protein